MYALLRSLRSTGMKAISGIFVCCTLCSGVALAEVDLTEFVNVTTETHENPLLGFSLKHPYLWESRPGPLNPADYHVSQDSYNLPSFSVVVQEREDVPQTSSGERQNMAHAAKKMFVQRTGLLSAEVLENLLEYERNIEFKGLVAVEMKVRFNSPYGEQIPLQAVLRAISTPERIYTLVAIDRYKEEALGEDLQEVLESFQIENGDLQ